MTQSTEQIGQKEELKKNIREIWEKLSNQDKTVEFEIFLNTETKEIRIHRYTGNFTVTESNLKRLGKVRQNSEPEEMFFSGSNYSDEPGMHWDTGEPFTEQAFWKECFEDYIRDIFVDYDVYKEHLTAEEGDEYCELIDDILYELDQEIEKDNQEPLWG